MNTRAINCVVLSMTVLAPEGLVANHVRGPCVSAGTGVDHKSAAVKQYQRNPWTGDGFPPSVPRAPQSVLRRCYTLVGRAEHSVCTSWTDNDLLLDQPALSEAWVLPAPVCVNAAFRLFRSREVQRRAGSRVSQSWFVVQDGVEPAGSEAMQVTLKRCTRL